jgi:hypothetical protein
MLILQLHGVIMCRTHFRDRVLCVAGGIALPMIMYGANLQYVTTVSARVCARAQNTLYRRTPYRIHRR